MTVKALALGFLLACFAPGCAAEEPEAAPDLTAEQEAEIGAEEQSFSSYDATDAELAAAPESSGAHGRPLDNELTLFAIPAPRLVGLSWKRPGGLARRTLISNGLGLHRSLGHAAVRVQ